MQYPSIKYIGQMAWLTEELQGLFAAAVSAPNQADKAACYGKIAELSARNAR